MLRLRFVDGFAFKFPAGRHFLSQSLLGDYDISVHQCVVDFQDGVQQPRSQGPLYSTQVAAGYVSARFVQIPEMCLKGGARQSKFFFLHVN